MKTEGNQDEHPLLNSGSPAGATVGRSPKNSPLSGRIGRGFSKAFSARMRT